MPRHLFNIRKFPKNFSAPMLASRRVALCPSLLQGANHLYDSVGVSTHSRNSAIVLIVRRQSRPS